MKIRLSLFEPYKGSGFTKLPKIDARCQIFVWHIIRVLWRSDSINRLILLMVNPVSPAWLIKTLHVCQLFERRRRTTSGPSIVFCWTVSWRCKITSESYHMFHPFPQQKVGTYIIYCIICWCGTIWVNLITLSLDECVKHGMPCLFILMSRASFWKSGLTSKTFSRSNDGVPIVEIDVMRSWCMIIYDNLMLLHLVPIVSPILFLQENDWTNG